MVEKNISLKTYNSFGVSVKSKIFFSFKTEQELIDYAKNELIDDEEVFILGGGSNVLLTKDINHTILHSKIKFIKPIKENKESIFIEVGSGLKWDDFVIYCVEKGYYGIENLSLIPGNIGAVPVQNIGAYGTEAKDVIYQVNGYDFSTQSKVVFSNQDCKFSYRNSVFKEKKYKKVIITSVVFKLSKQPHYKTKIKNFKGNFFVKRIKYLGLIISHIGKALKSLKINKKSIRIDYRYLKAIFEDTGLFSLKKIRQTIVNKRKSKLPDPDVIGNVGSFFKNTIISVEKANTLKKQFPKIVLYPLNNEFVKVSTGWLIKECGWTGKNDENVGLYKDQTLIIINLNNATGAEIVSYSEKIKKSVFDKFGINIEEEVIIK